MTAFRSLLLALALALAPAFAQADAQSKAVACERLEAVAEPFTEIEETQAFMFSPCLDLNIRLTQQFVTRLAERVSALSAPQGSDVLVDDDPDVRDLKAHSEELAEAKLVLAGLEVRQALLRQQPKLALTRLRMLPELSAKDTTEVTPDTGELSAEVAAAWGLNLAPIEEILTGKRRPPQRAASFPDHPLWVVISHDLECGTGQFAAEYVAVTHSTTIDAWIAVGQPEVALQQLLLRNWEFDASNLVLPIGQKQHFARHWTL